ncbi:Patatin phospholipase [uncultured virus]|nr:Patatin phospholipase [uncultured virus]
MPKSGLTNNRNTSEITSNVIPTNINGAHTTNNQRDITQLTSNHQRDITQSTSNHQRDITQSTSKPDKSKLFLGNKAMLITGITESTSANIYDQWENYDTSQLMETDSLQRTTSPKNDLFPFRQFPDPTMNIPTCETNKHNTPMTNKTQSNIPDPLIESRNWMPRVLVIGPGGFKGLKALGFLSPIEDSGLLQCTDTYCGVSAGAIISLLVVAGYQIREIVGEASTLNLFKDLDNLTVQSIIDNKGLISNEPIRKRLTQLVLNKFGTIPTLWGLYMQTGKAYVAVTLNATDEECEIMGPFTHPHISCVDATMFSMNIPFVFYQLIYQGKTYVDGALGNPYPVDYFDDENTNILGIYMKTVNNIGTRNKNINYNRDSRGSSTNNHQTDREFASTISSRSNSQGVILQRIDHTPAQALPIGTYSFKIIHALMDQRRNHIIQQSSPKCKHICLETKQVNIVGYSLTKEDKADMLVEGFNEGKAFIAQLYNNTYIGPRISSKLSYVYPPYYMKGETNSDDRHTFDEKELPSSVDVLFAMNQDNNTVPDHNFPH